MFDWIKQLFGQKNRQYEEPQTAALRPEPVKRDPTKPINFGHKCIWAAVSTENTELLLKVLDLAKIAESDWVNGMTKARDGEVFVLPPIEGWTLMTGWGLPTPDHAHGIVRSKELIDDLSENFGEAQLLGNFRGSGAAFWMRSINGETERLYSIGDGKAFIEGTPTEIEKQWDLIDPSSPEAAQEEYWDRMVYPEAEHVLEVANNWSINPMELEQREDLAETGYVGRLRRK